LIQETNLEKKRELSKETSSTKIDASKSPLPGLDTEQDTGKPIINVAWPSRPAIVEVGYRSFDLQYIIADSRVLDMARPDLWAARSSEQLFLVEQQSHYPKSGPVLIITSLIHDIVTINNGIW